MKIALAQLNPIIGDLEGNSTRIIEACKKAAENKAELVLTPELSLWGYPPKDLLLKSNYFKLQNELLSEISFQINNKSPKLKLLIGIPEQINHKQIPNLFNSIVLIENNNWKVIARKQLLPSYDVFDEARYFRPASDIGILKIKSNKKDWKIGVTICEDIWVDNRLNSQRIKGSDPIAKFIDSKINLLVNLSASPFEQGKDLTRKRIVANAAYRLNCPVIYLNQVGGNDSLIFDGLSFVSDQKGKVQLSLPQFKESISYWDSRSSNILEDKSIRQSKEILFKALILGVRDYAKKCGFKSTLIGLSGGIDSSLVTTIAVAAMGANNVKALLMPSPWSSKGSVEDSLDLAKRLNIKTKIIKIKELMKTFDSTLNIPLGMKPQGITAENLQARIRGTLLMAFANEENHLLLSTGNKSELAVGYCTLYGDMNGGLSVIGDLYKTTVFELCKWLDSKESLPCRELFNLPIEGEVIGKVIRSKPPSAELRPNQLDQDFLPDYSMLDPILKDLIEENLSTQALIEKGYELNLITAIQNLMKKAEFKREQAPPLLKVSKQSFGSGWRIPIATN